MSRTRWIGSRRFGAAIAALLMATVLTGCMELFGPLNNPVDPDAQDFQGYESVDDPADISAVTDNGAILLFPDFMVNHVVDANAYRLEIASTESFDPGSVLHSANAYSDNDLRAATDLTAGVTYYWRAAAQKGGSWGPWTDVRSFTMADLVHVSPSAGATTSGAMPKLSWEPVTDATGYQIQIAEIEDDLGSAPIVDVGAAEFVVPEPLTNQQNHYWRFRAVTDSGRATGWSSPRAFYVASVGAVSDLSAAVGDGVVELTWKDPDDADLAEISVMQEPEGGSAQRLSPGSEQLLITGLTNNSTYTFTVIASNTDGDNSVAVSVSATPTDAPRAVTGLSAMPAATHVQITWSDPDYLGLDSIDVVWTPDGINPVILAPGTETYTATDLLNGSEYTFSVTARYADGSSSAAETITVRTGLPDTIAWAGVSPTDGGSTVNTTPTLDWDDVFGAARYELQVAETEAGLPTAAIQTITASEYTPASFLSNSSTYYWRLRALDADDNSTDWSSVFSFTVDWGTLTGLSPADAATGSDTTPTLAWDTVTGAVSYEVQVADSESELSSITPATTADTSYTPSLPLTNNDSHYWRVRAEDANGQFGPWSPVRSFAVMWGGTSGQSPSNGETVEDIHPTLSWDAIAGAVSYEVQLSDSESEVESAQLQSVSTNSYTSDTALSNEQVHYWRVRAKDVDGQYGVWSAVYSLAISWGTISGMAPADTATVPESKPELTWDAVPDAISYSLQIATSETGLSSTVPEELSTSFFTPTVELSYGETYFWRVRAGGPDNVYGAWSSTNRFTVDLSVVSGGSPTDGTEVITTRPVFSWDAVEQANTYELQIADTEDGLPGAPTESTSGLNYTAPTSFSNDHTYYWRIRAVTGSGWNGPWSAVRSFTVRWGRVTGLLPESDYPTIYPNLGWDNMPETANYNIQFSADPGSLSSSSTLSTVGTSYDLGEVAPDQTYYWRIQAVHETGFTGPWSDTESFSIALYALGAPGPAGGYIVHDMGYYSNGWRYIEAAPSDQSTGIVWGGNETSVGDLGADFGDGLANTDSIIAALDAGTYAAMAAREFTVNGYNDWYLPSFNELMATLTFAKGITIDAEYWSSSENSATTAWTGKNAGGVGSTNVLLSTPQKTELHRVRAVRRF